MLVVPSAAMVHEAGESGVWQSVDGIARFGPVVVGNQGQAGVVEVVSGLKAGDSVIVYSSAQLKDGSRVNEVKVKP